MVQTSMSSEPVLVTGARPPRRGAGTRATGLMMVLPVVAIIAVFTIYAFGYAVHESTQLSSPFFPPRFVGLDNFRSVIGSPYFAAALRVTATFALFATPLVV